MPPQAIAIYRLLLSYGPMTALDIAKRLNIFPHSVYRAAKTLIDTGLIVASANRPIRFSPVPSSLGIATYLARERQKLEKLLGTGDSNQPAWTANSVELISSRDEWLRRSNEDQRRAKREVGLIISGHEVPAEVVFEHKQAIDRGVSVKMLIQKGPHITKQMIATWQNIGMEVRISKFLSLRLNVYDGAVAYIISYDPKIYQEAVGVRFTYTPIAQLLHDLFLKYWAKGQPIP